MTQNERELLLKDLCTRLPYGVKVESVFISPGTKEHKPCGIEVFNETCLLMIRDGLGEFKPYLFPLSSMTEEQLKLFDGVFLPNGHIVASDFGFDYLNSIHVDYRGLISIGLAIDCTNLNIY